MARRTLSTAVGTKSFKVLETNEVDFAANMAETQRRARYKDNPILPLRTSEGGEDPFADIYKANGKVFLICWDGNGNTSESQVGTTLMLYGPGRTQVRDFTPQITANNAAAAATLAYKRMTASAAAAEVGHKRFVIACVEDWVRDEHTKLIAHLDSKGMLKRIYGADKEIDPPKSADPDDKSEKPVARTFLHFAATPEGYNSLLAGAVIKSEKEGEPDKVLPGIPHSLLSKIELASGAKNLDEAATKGKAQMERPPIIASTGLPITFKLLKIGKDLGRSDTVFLANKTLLQELTPEPDEMVRGPDGKDIEVKHLLFTGTSEDVRKVERLMAPKGVGQPVRVWVLPHPNPKGVTSVSDAKTAADTWYNNAKTAATAKAAAATAAAAARGKKSYTNSHFGANTVGSAPGIVQPQSQPVP